MSIVEAMNKRDEERNRQMFERMIGHFTKTFRPKDPYEAEEFDRDPPGTS